MSEFHRSNPYVGLRPFFADDSLYFFGRTAQTAELLEILHAHRFLGVVGSSGSGKSSLVRAGLIPKLLGGFLAQDRDAWRIVLLKPGDAPIGNLASALQSAMGGKPGSGSSSAELEAAIRNEHVDAVVDFLRSGLASNENVFVLVDQFEEIFAFRGGDVEDDAKALDPARRRELARRRAEAADFVDLLLGLSAERDFPVYVTLTMRTDFLGDCDVFYGLPEALNRGRYLVPRLTRAQLREAIDGPAMLMRARIAPRLLDDLVNVLGDRFDRLPVLQHALLRTWDAWLRAGGVGPIDQRHYAAAGGLEGALDKDAEDALAGLDLDVTALVFKRLTDTDASQRRVRRPARISQLVDAAGTDRKVVEAIVRRFHEDGRSFVHESSDGRPDDPRVDISHESLIRQWNRLRAWVDEERRSRDQYLELVARARKGELAAPLQDPELHVVLGWRKEARPTPAWAGAYASLDGDFALAMGYLQTSLEHHCRQLAEAELQRRWRRIWNPLILGTLLLAGVLTTELGGLFDVQVAGAGASQTTPAEGGGQAAQALLEVPGAGDESLNRVGEVAWSRVTKYWYLGFFVLLYFGASEIGRRWHRRVAFPRILQELLESDGVLRDVADAQADPQREATDVHQTTYASTLRRVLGYLIDVALYIVIGFVTMIFLMIMLDAAFGIDSAAPEVVIPDAYMQVVFAAYLVIAWLYEATPIALPWQATPGMLATGTFRTGLHGERLSFVRASVWFFYRLISYAGFGVGFLIQPFTARRQTFHDRMAGTVVLRRPPRTTK